MINEVRPIDAPRSHQKLLYVPGSPALGALIWGTYGTGRMGLAFGLAVQMRRRPSKAGEIAMTLLRSREHTRAASNILLSCLMIVLALRVGL